MFIVIGVIPEESSFSSLIFTTEIVLCKSLFRKYTFTTFVTVRILRGSFIRKCQILILLLPEEMALENNLKSQKLPFYLTS